MKVSLESTTKIVELNGMPARIWEGETDSGIKVHAFITRIAALITENLAQFEAELKECSPPSNGDVRAYPMRLIL